MWKFHVIRGKIKGVMTSRVEVPPLTGLIHFFLSSLRVKFLRWRPRWPSWINDRNDFSCLFINKSPRYFLSFPVNQYFGSREEVQNSFLRWRPLRPSWISNRTSFSLFWSSSHPNSLYQFSGRFAFQFQRRSLKYIIKMPATTSTLVSR